MSRAAVRWRALFLGAATAVLASVAVPSAMASGESGTAQQARASQWWLESLNVAKAHRVSQGEGVVVCIADTGVDASHPDLAGASFRPGADLSGVGADDGLAALGSSHGTSMAGLIVGQGSGPGRSSGTLGVAPRATVISVSIDEDRGMEEPIKVCADLGADVISASVSATVDPAAVAYAQARDIVLVAGTGNAGAREGISELAGRWGVLAVTGVDKRLVLDPGANAAGPTFPLQVADPEPSIADTGGVGIAGPFSTTGSAADGACGGFFAPDIPKGWVNICGTSPATAIVAGVVALVRAEHPDLNAANVINRVLRTAKPPTTGSKKVPSPLYGFGVVDAYAAVTAEVAEVKDNPLGSCYTGGRGIWDSRVTPTRAEPPAGVSLAPAPWDAPIVDVTAAPPATETAAPAPTTPAVPSEAPSPGAAPPTTAEGGSGLPVAIWVAIAVAVLAPVAAVLRSRRTSR